MSQINKNINSEFCREIIGSYLHRFSWLKDKEVGSLPKEWNHLVLEYPEASKPSLLHFTVGALVFRISTKVKKQNCTILFFKKGFDICPKNK